MNYTDTGFLIVNAYMAMDAIPVPSALVRVMGAEEMNSTEARSEITDEDGVTAPIRLSAPASSYSLSPGAAEQPYALYDVVLYKQGFYTKHVYNVAVFSGITTVLPVNMVINDKEGSEPIGSLDVISHENPNLE